MFKYNIFISFVSFFIIAGMFSCDKKSDQYEISGKLDNLTGGHFYMSHEVGDSIIIDTIKVNSAGEFSFKGNVDTLTMVSLYFNENTKGTFVLVERGWDVKLKGDVMIPDLIEVKGGEINDDLTDFKTKNKELIEQRAEILNDAEKQVNMNDSIVANDHIGNLKNINFELANLAANYIKENPDKIASVMLINIFFRDETSFPRLDQSLKQLKGKAADFPMTAELKKFRDQVMASKEGSFAPYLSSENLKGKRIKVSDYKGKYVLLSFVSTTCDVCLDEKKDMIAVYNELKKQKLDIEFISIVKDVEQVPIPENITDSVKWEILPVKGGWGAKAFEDYYVREIPYNILIGPTTYIVIRDIPIAALPDKLKALTANTKK